MKTNKMTSFNTKSIYALALLPILLLAGVPAHAGFLQIDFTATISNDGGTTTDDIVGSFTLDTDVLFAIGVGAIDNLITDASFTSTLFGSETGDAGSAFTFASAAQRTGYGALTLIADYGSGFFSLDLASDNFFTTANAFDDLTEDLMLASLRSFNPADLDTTQFVNFIGFTDEWEGALTSLSFTVPEPSVLWLMLLGAPWLIRRSRHA